MSRTIRRIFIDDGTTYDPWQPKHPVRACVAPCIHLPCLHRFRTVREALDTFAPTAIHPLDWHVVTTAAWRTHNRETVR